MRGEGIKTLVVEHCQQAGIGRYPIPRLPRRRRSYNLQLPLFLLARCQSVAEGGPLHLQRLVGHRTTDELLVAIALTILNPCVGQQQSTAILFTIGKLAIDEFAILLDGTTLQQFLANKEAIDNIQVGV